MTQRRDSRTRSQAAHGPKENSANRCDGLPLGNEAGQSLENWQAIRDSTYGLCQLNMSVLNLEPHLILLDDQRSIADAEAHQRIRDWLTEVPVQLVMNNLAPTLFVDFDGTLHVGNT